MTDPSRHATSPRGVSAVARVSGWLFALALVLAATATGWATTGERMTGAATPTGIAAHLDLALDAAVVPVASSVGHPESPRLLPLADAGNALSALLVLGLAMTFLTVAGRRAQARATLPPLRGPPYRLPPR